MELTESQIKNPTYFVPVGEAKEEKRQLERDIMDRLDAFRRATGLWVSSLDIQSIEVNSLSGPATVTIQSVTAEVRL